MRYLFFKFWGFYEKLLSLTILSAVVAMQGCATIIQGSDQTLSFKSVPELAKITVTNRAGEKYILVKLQQQLPLKREQGISNQKITRFLFLKMDIKLKLLTLQEVLMVGM